MVSLRFIQNLKFARISPCSKASNVNLFFFLFLMLRKIPIAVALGLACKVTREIDMGEQTAEVKQCMPVNEPIVVEKLTEYDVNETLDPGSAALDPAARFYPGKVRKK